MIRAFADRSRLRAAQGAVLIGAAFWFLCGWSFFDPFHEHVEKGNHDAKKGSPADALGHYETAGKLVPASPIPDFNRGIVLSQKGEVDQARSAFEAAQAANDIHIAADAHYNLGNLLLQKDDTDGAIEQYLRSLDLDPADPDARRNLEIAIRRKQEQQQQQQQQQQKDPSQKDQDKKQQDQDQKKNENGEKKDQDQKNPDSGKKDEQQQQQNPSPEKQDEQKPENPGENGESPLRPEEQLSKEDAARLLNAIQNDELKVLRALEEKKEQSGAVGNDW